MKSRFFLALLAAFSTLCVSSAHAMSRSASDPTRLPAGEVPLTGPGPKVLRVLNLNVFGVPKPKIDASRWKDIGILLKKMRDEGTGPHIVALQEMFMKKSQMLIDEAQYPYMKKGPRASGAKLNSGLVILSEFPIEESFFTAFNHCTSWDCFARKGALGIRFSIPGAPHPFFLFTLHANSDPDTDPTAHLGEAQDARFAQFQDFRDLVDDHKPGQYPAIYVGDFNTTVDGYDYESFLAFTHSRDAVDVCRRTPSQCSTNVTNIDEDWATMLDRQFVLRGSSPRIEIKPIRYERIFTEPYKGRKLSDHPGLYMHYELSW